jgi:RNA polymerase subunit RPABC4/transcription elongation factor Spt4
MEKSRSTRACTTCRTATDPSNPIYNQPDAEKAWAKLVALYKAALV